MKNEELRVLFAAFAMVSKTWVSGKEDIDARRCYEIADAMIAAKDVDSEEGIVGVIKKSRKPKEA